MSIILTKVFIFLLNAVCLYKFTRNAFNIDWNLVTEQKAIYSALGALCCVHVKLLFLLPWHSSEAAKVTGGYPSFRVYCISNFMLLFDTVLITGIQVIFAVNVREIFDLPLSTRVSFVLTTSCTLLFGVVTFVEMLFVRSAYQASEAKNGSRPSLTQKLIDS